MWRYDIKQFMCHWIEMQIVKIIYKKTKAHFKVGNLTAIYKAINRLSRWNFTKKDETKMYINDEMCVAINVLTSMSS